jgi:hypothetical protein
MIRFVNSARQARALQRAVSTAVLCAAFTAASSAAAGGDHDKAPAGPSVAAMPRFAAESEAFELVGVLENGSRLRLWLDRWSDNEPVRDARIELEIGTAKVTATAASDGAGYAATLPAPLAEGVHPITVQVSVGAESDLLAAEIDVHADEPAARAAPSSALWLASLSTVVPRTIGAIAAVIAAAIAAFFILRARRARGSLQ